MNVYLLRHGLAAERDAAKFPNDDERPLTREGVEKMREAAVAMAALVGQPDLILTSPLVRTKQTADIVARALSCKDRVATSEALKPGAEPDALRTVVAEQAGRGVESILLVGHEPQIGEVTSGLIGAQGSIVEFKKGSLCAIRLNEENIDDLGVLLWHLTPKQLRTIGKGL